VILVNIDDVCMLRILVFWCYKYSTVVHCIETAPFSETAPLLADTDTPEIKICLNFVCFFIDSIEAAEKCTPFSYSRRVTQIVLSFNQPILVSSQCTCWVSTSLVYTLLACNA